MAPPSNAEGGVGVVVEVGPAGPRRRAGAARPATAPTGSRVDRWISSASPAGVDGVERGGMVADVLTTSRSLGLEEVGEVVEPGVDGRLGADRHQQAHVVAPGPRTSGGSDGLERGRQVEVERGGQGRRRMGAAVVAATLGSALGRRRRRPERSWSHGSPPPRRGPGSGPTGSRPGSAPAGRARCLRAAAGPRCPRRGRRPGACRVRMSPGSTQYTARLGVLGGQHPAELLEGGLRRRRTRPIPRSPRRRRRR